MRSRTAWKLCPAASSSGARSPSATATAARRAASSRLSPSSASTAGATTSHLAARAQELPDELPFGAAAGAGGGAEVEAPPPLALDRLAEPRPGKGPRALPGDGVAQRVGPGRRVVRRQEAQRAPQRLDERVRRVGVRS